MENARKFQKIRKYKSFLKSPKKSLVFNLFILFIFLAKNKNVILLDLPIKEISL